MKKNYKLLATDLDAVSYTHLDVYKRQQEVCPISTRYIANKVSYTYKNREINEMYNLLKNMKDEAND